MSYYYTIMSLLVLSQSCSSQINFGGGGSSSNNRPNRGNSRPSFSSNGGGNGFSFNNNDNRRPPSKGPVSVEFGSGSSSSSSSNVKSLIDLLGKDAPSPSLNTRRQNVGTRRRGSTCTTPLGEAGTCQYIFSSQCSSILQ